MTLQSSIKLSVSATQTSALDLGSASFQAALDFIQSFSDGAGAGAANLLFTDTRTLAASGAESLDLAGGGLTDAFGAALTFARVKCIFIVAISGNTNDVQVTRPASNGLPLFMAASDGIALSPGESFMWGSPTSAGKVVTAGTGDLLTITNSAGTTGVTYKILILGAAT